jgi:hypothetical protein
LEKLQVPTPCRGVFIWYSQLMRVPLAPYALAMPRFSPTRVD